MRGEAGPRRLPQTRATEPGHTPAGSVCRSVRARLRSVPCGSFSGSSGCHRARPDGGIRTRLALARRMRLLPLDAGSRPQDRRARPGPVDASSARAPPHRPPPSRPPPRPSWTRSGGTSSESGCGPGDVRRAGDRPGCATTVRSRRGSIWVNCSTWQATRPRRGDSSSRCCSGNPHSRSTRSAIHPRSSASSASAPTTRRRPSPRQNQRYRCLRPWCPLPPSAMLGHGVYHFRHGGSGPRDGLPWPPRCIPRSRCSALGGPVARQELPGGGRSERVRLNRNRTLTGVMAAGYWGTWLTSAVDANIHWRRVEGPARARATSSTALLLPPVQVRGSF